MADNDYKEMIHSAEEIDRAVDLAKANATEVYALKNYAMQVIQTELNALEKNKADAETVEELKEDIEKLNKEAEDIYTKSEVDEKLNDKVEKIEGKGLSANDFSDEYKNKINKNAEDLENTYSKSEVDKKIGDKVDKIEGKGLSTNDFDNKYKSKVDNTYSKSEVDSKVKDKVDKVEGKDLSTNDFTDDYQKRVHDAYAKATESISEVERLKSSKADKTALDETNATVAANKENLQGQIDALVLEAGGDSNAEVVQARTGSDGTAHNTLKARLDSMETEDADLKENLNHKVNADTFNVFLTDTNTKTEPSRNLFNVNDPDCAEGKTLNSDGNLANNADHFTTGFIPVETNRALYPSFNGMSKTVLFFTEYDVDKNFIKQDTYFGAGKKTTSSDTKYIRCVVPHDYGDINKFQIEYDRTTAYIEFRNVYSQDTSSLVKKSEFENFTSDINVESKISQNLFDINSPDTLVGKTLSTTGQIQANANHVVSPYIEVEHDRALNPSYNGVAHTVINRCEYDANKAFIRCSQYFSNGDKITDSNTKYIRFVIPKDYGDYTKFQLEYDNVTAWKRYGIVYEEKKTSNTITVKTNGSGDFTSLRQAIEYANTHAPCIIKVGEGTYDLSSEFTSEEISNANYPDGFYGVEIKSNVTLEAAGRKEWCIIKAELEKGSSVETSGAISTLNLNGANITLKGLTITGNNIRYVIHDDFAGNANATHNFIDCDIIEYSGAQGIGAGARTGQVINIDSCRVSGISWHTAPEGYYRPAKLNVYDTVIDGVINIGDWDSGKESEFNFRNVKYTAINVDNKSSNSNSHEQLIRITGCGNSEEIIASNTDVIYNTDEVSVIRASDTISKGDAIKRSNTNSCLRLSSDDSSEAFYGIALESAESGSTCKVQSRGYINITLKCGITANVGDKIGIINGSIAVVTSNEIAVVKSVIAGNAYAKLK